jgi:hypothetical protein
MKNTIKTLTVAILSIISLSFASAQFSESFEGTFFPAGWSGAGFTKTNEKKKSGVYSAISLESNHNSSDNYLKINSMSIGSGVSLSINALSKNGDKKNFVYIYVKNQNINNGDSVFVLKVNPDNKEWTTIQITFPSAYQNTNNNSVYFVIVRESNGNGNERIYFDDVTSNNPMPVEMQSFTYNVNLNNVKLNWKTSTEINNKGFEVERKSGSDWTKIGFVPANSSKTYTFSDKNLQSGKYQYRLKQIDFNGNFEYHNLNGTVTIEVPGKYSLSQNYPNPFNPSTKISFELPKDENVSLKIYDNTGKVVATLVNGMQTAGYHTVEFKSNLSSGIYFFNLTAGSFSETKKMTVVK